MPGGRTPPGCTPTQHRLALIEEIRAYYVAHPCVTQKEVCAALRVHRATVSRAIREIRKSWR